MASEPRVVKAQLPIKTLITAVVIGLVLLAFIIYAAWESGRGIKEARMTGTIVKKEFEPQPEEQIILSKKGEIRAHHKEGEYILTVEVPQKDGSKKSYYVFVNKEAYEASKIGDSYDVGPALVRE